MTFPSHMDAHTGDEISFDFVKYPAQLRLSNVTTAISAMKIRSGFTNIESANEPTNENGCFCQ